MNPQVVIGDEVLMPPRNGLITLRYRSNPSEMNIYQIWLKFKMVYIGIPFKNVGT